MSQIGYENPMVLHKSAIIGISSVVTGAVGGMISLGVSSFGGNLLGLYSLVIFGIAIPVSWLVAFEALKYKNTRDMHGKERDVLIKIGTKIAKQRLAHKLGLQVDDPDDDPTRSPFIEEARLCVDYYLAR